MTLPVVWSDQAREDFISIIDYIRDQSPGAAERLADALDTSTWALPEHPDLYRLSSRMPECQNAGKSSYMAITLSSTA